MAAFRFSLQRVLDMRRESELESAKGLADARTEADAARGVREALAEARAAGVQRLAEAHGAGGSIGHLRNLAYVVSKVDERITHADEACREADERVSTQMKEFHEAFMRRKSLDQLKERRLDQWRTDEVRSERSVLDEVALTRHARQGSSGRGEER